ncbi:MAG: YcxB family protein [Pyrinomonadaceae bacterium]|nr:YcxB family protein [Pyrinomonadaceae bacterium]
MDERKIKIEVKYTKKIIFLNCIRTYFTGNSLFYSFFGFFTFANVLILFFNDFAKISTPFLILVTFLFTIIWLLILSIIFTRPQNQGFTFIFSDNFIEYGNNDYQSIVKWSYFNYAKESSQILKLFMNDGNIVLIPLNDIDNDKLIVIKELIKAKFGDNAKLKG